LKALFVIVAVLAVPMGMLGSGVGGLILLGCYALCIGVGGSLGYLLGGWERVVFGISIGALVPLAFGLQCVLLDWLLS